MGKHFVIIYSLIFLILGAVLSYSYRQPIQPLNDTIEYIHASNNLLTNNILYSGDLNNELDFRLYSKRTLGYPMFLLFQAQNQTVVLLANTLLYLLIFLLGLQVLTHFSTKRMVFLCYCILFLIHITLSIHASWQMADLLVTACITAIAAVFYIENSTVKSRVLAVSVLWSISLLLKPVFLPSLLLIPFLIIYLRIKTAEWIIFPILPILIFIIGSTVNLLNSSVFEYSSISTINLGQYNTKLMVANTSGANAANKFTNEETFAIPRTPSEYIQYKTRVRGKSLLAMKENPVAYAKVHMTGVMKMIVDPGRFEVYTFLDENDHNISLTELLYAGDWQSIQRIMAKNKLLLLFFLALFAVSFVKLLLATVSLGKTKSTLFILFLIAYFVLITGPVGAARFMLPVSVLYIVLASVGAGLLLAFFQKSSKS